MTLSPQPHPLDTLACFAITLLTGAHARGHCGELVGALMAPVIIESPYAGDIEANLTYLRACMRDCLMRGEAPFASHALYTQPGVLRDDDPAERARGIEAGFCWRPFVRKTVVYTDRGITEGMKLGIAHAKKMTWHTVEYRELGHT
jgi:hypothetical protein